MQIADIKNACSLRAIKNVTQAPDETIIETALKYGASVQGKWRPGIGMVAERRCDSYGAVGYHRITRELGVQLKKIDVGFNYRPRDMRVFGCHYQGVLASDGMTVSTFLSQHPTGTFFVEVRGHVFVVRDGVVHDQGRKQHRRTVQAAAQILNPAPLPELKYVQLVKRFRKARNPNSMAAVRYRQMSTYVWWKCPRATPDDIFKNTLYRPQDLAYDLRVGNVRMVAEP
jgi:hypothetical protein